MLLGQRINGEWLCPSLCCGHLCSLLFCDPLLSTPINICLLHCDLLLTWAPAPAGGASISHSKSGSCGGSSCVSWDTCFYHRHEGLGAMRPRVLPPAQAMWVQLAA